MKFIKYILVFILIVIAVIVGLLLLWMVFYGIYSYFKKKAFNKKLKEIVKELNLEALKQNNYLVDFEEIECEDSDGDLYDNTIISIHKDIFVRLALASNQLFVILMKKEFLDKYYKANDEYVSVYKRLEETNDKSKIRQFEKTADGILKDWIRTKGDLAEKVVKEKDYKISLYKNAVVISFKDINKTENISLVFQQGVEIFNNKLA